jgi:hypothetical protein
MAAATLFCVAGRSSVWAQQPYWELKPVQVPLDERAEEHAPVDLNFTEGVAHAEDRAFPLRRDADSDQHRTVDDTVGPAEFSQPDAEELIPQPSSLDSDDSERSVARELELLNQRIKELEAAKIAHEDATRTIIRQSFAERGSNINDYVVFGGTLEMLTFLDQDFNRTRDSNIVLDTAELDFEIQVSDWLLGSFIMEYDAGTDVLFSTSEGDEFAVDRVNMRQAWITIGNTQRFPLFGTFGRDVVPFGISTGDPVVDVLSLISPLTVSAFETREDFIMFGFAMPTPPPPRLYQQLRHPFRRQLDPCLSIPLSADSAPICARTYRATHHLRNWPRRIFLQPLFLLSLRPSIFTMVIPLTGVKTTSNT